MPVAERVLFSARVRNALTLWTQALVGTDFSEGLALA